MFESKGANTKRISIEQLRAGSTLIMGVLNVTPDSFSDGGRFAATERALEQARLMVSMGADIIDVGGESTRPGASRVAVDEELRRVIPVIQAITDQNLAAVSVDTSQAKVMHAAVAAGASMINDVRALTLPGAMEAAKALSVPVCLMHMQGQPESMQDSPQYNDVVDEVIQFLTDRIAACTAAGIDDQSILVDPGFGFGKRLDDNLALLRRLDEITGLGYPVLVGLSRKSMIGELTGKPVDQRLIGSVMLAAIAASRGASVVRVHDVAETREALTVMQSVLPQR